MPIGTTMAILGGLSAAGAIGSGLAGANAAENAAAAQTAALMQALGLMEKYTQQGLRYQGNQLRRSVRGLQPWLTAGQESLGSLGWLLGLPGGVQPSDEALAAMGEFGTQGGLLRPWEREFTAPGLAGMQEDPGYQFRLQEGGRLLQQSAAARGGLLTGATGQALQQYGQNLASQEYGNVYGRRLGEYQQAYNIFQQNQANLFNRLWLPSQAGQQAAGQIGGWRMGAAGQRMNFLGGQSQAMANLYGQVGQAQAAGSVGAYNAGAGAFGNFMNMLPWFMPQQSQAQAPSYSYQRWNS